jgi:hypothetical protein
MKIIRTVIAILIAYLLAFAFQPSPLAATVGNLLLPIAIIFAIAFGLLSWVAINRRERLKQEVATELNKIRRIYHLGKNLGAVPYLRNWFTDLHGFIYDYLGCFSKFDLSEYEKGNALFRRIAYHVYTLPELHEVKEQVLYDELLEATAEVSNARQSITTLLRIRYSQSHWFELAVLVLVFTASVVLATVDNVLSRIFTANLLAAGYVLVLTFMFHDLWTKPSDRRLSDEYVRNIARLELRRG